MLRRQPRSTLFPYHDALPIYLCVETTESGSDRNRVSRERARAYLCGAHPGAGKHASSGRCFRCPRSEEHTSELQSQFHLVCRLLLEKKNQWNGDNKINSKKLS